MERTRLSGSARGSIVVMSPAPRRKTSTTDRPSLHLSFRWRYRIVCIVFAAVAVVLLARAAHVQLIDRAFYQQEAESRFLHRLPVSASRGRLLDRNGVVIAGSAPVLSLWVDPKEFFETGQSIAALASTLDIAPEPLQALLERHRDKRFVYLPGFRRREPAGVHAVLDDVPRGVYTQREFKRFYPQSYVISQIVGTTDIDSAGQEGLELLFDARLQGRPGYTDVVRDRFGRPIERHLLRQPALAGEDIVLSIDGRLQRAVYDGLRSSIQTYGASSGSMVILEVGTGQVLAMANWPSFNNNIYSVDERHARRNRVLTDVFEPGSTVKPFTVAAGLVADTIDPGSRFDTHPGWIRNGRFTTRDYRNLGVLDLGQALNRSSNVAMAQIAGTLSNAQLRDAFADMGVGQVTGIAFPGERAGSLAALSSWSGTTKQTLSYGYGLSMTTLQLANAYATLANGGVSVVPTLEKSKEMPGQRVLPETVARAIVDLLSASTEPGATARRAAIAGYSIAGKTGTARKASAGGYERRYFSLFAGIVPASQPRYAVAVVIDDPDPSSGRYGGGSVAAPTFSAIMARALWLAGVPPDLE